MLTSPPLFFAKMRLKCVKICDHFFEKKWAYGQKKWAKRKFLKRQFLLVNKILTFWPKKVVIWPKIFKKWAAKIC